MILSFINIRKVPREMLKTSGFALGFQHLPWNLANVMNGKSCLIPILSNINMSCVRIKIVFESSFLAYQVNRIHHWCSVGTGKSQPEGPPFQ